MILIDTSLWIEHFRKGDERLASLLDADQVAIHPFITGELALGTLRNRSRILALLDALPQAPVVATRDALTVVDRHELAGCGIGYVDLHLLAAVLQMREWTLWTRDKRLLSIAVRLNLVTAFSD